MVFTLFRSKETGKVDIALIGDSHAGHLFYGLAEELNTKNVLFIGLYGVNGLPFINNDHYKKIFLYILNTDIKTVVISLYWETYLANDVGDSSKFGLLQTVDTLVKGGKTVYLMTDGPRFGFDPSRCKYTRFKISNKCTESSARYDELNRKIMPTLQQAAKLGNNVVIVNTQHYYCDKGICSMLQNGKEIFADKNHLNISGSLYVAKKIVKDYPQLLLN